MDFLERRKRILPISLLAAIVPLLLFFTIPFETYCANFEELDFPFIDIFPYHIVIAFVGIVCIWIVLFLLPKKLYSLLYGFILGLGFMLYLQNNMLNRFEDSSLALDSFSGITEKGILINSIIWIVVILAFSLIFFFLLKKSNIQLIGIILCVFLLTAQVTSFVGEIAANPKVFLSWKERHNEKLFVETTEGISTISNNHNVFVFCIDRLDERVCEEIYKSYPEVFEPLSDFVWYQNCTSQYGHTCPSVVYMMTGVDHIFGETRNEYFEHAYSDSEALHILKNNNYKIRLYSDPYYSYSTGRSLKNVIENTSEVKDKVIRSKESLVNNMILVSIYKTSPFYLRGHRIFQKLSVNTLMSSVSTICDKTQYSSDVNSVIQIISNENINLTDNNVYTFIHTDGFHVLDYYTWTGTAVDAVENKTEAFCRNLEIVKIYIERMKELGVYDESTIIVTGDHGNIMSDCSPLTEANLTAMFVKPSKSGNFNFDRTTIAHKDLFSIIFESEGIEDIRAKEQDSTRNFYWDTNDLKRYVYDIYEDSRLFSNWKLKEVNTSGMIFSENRQYVS